MSERVMQHVPAAFVRVGELWPVKDHPGAPAPRLETVSSVAYDAAAPWASRVVIVTMESGRNGYGSAPDAPVWIMAPPGRCP